MGKIILNKTLSWGHGMDKVENQVSRRVEKRIDKQTELLRVFHKKLYWVDDNPLILFDEFFIIDKTSEGLRTFYSLLYSPKWFWQSTKVFEVIIEEEPIEDNVFFYGDWKLVK